MAELTQARLRELLNYNSKTGVFTCRKTRSSKAVAGQVVGHAHPAGYLWMVIDYRRYLCHRLAWLYVHGKWPPVEIDHINGVRDDNRLVNLRIATISQNRANARKRRDNSSGFKGVYWVARYEQWIAQIVLNRKAKYLGHFDSAEDAHDAYCKAAQKHFGEFARFK